MNTKKNILYIGQYKDNSGLGESCRRFVDCFIESGHNLSLRPIYVTSNSMTPYINLEEHEQFENNTYKKYDIIIQHMFPEYMEYNHSFGKNIGIANIETMNIKHSGWIDKLNFMDEIWTGSYFSAESMTNSGVTKPIKIVPEPYKIDRSKIDPFFSYKNTEEHKPYVFYTIGSYTEKHNIKNILMSFLMEFNKNDNVRLFIKTSHPGQKNDDLENIIKFDIQNIKNIIRKPYSQYPDIDVLCGILSRKDINRLHKSCNCYVNAVMSDGFGASAIEAALYDNLVITTKNIGSSTYFNSSNALMIDSEQTTTYSSFTNIKNIYTTNEYWYSPLINDIRNQMKTAYNDQHATTFLNEQIFAYQNVHGII